MTGFILAIVFFIILAGFFSGSEIGLVSVNRVRLRVLAEGKKASAVILQRMLNKPAQMLSTMLVGTNVCIVISTVLFARMIYDICGVDSEWITPAVMAPLILIFGEFIPKALYSKNTNNITYLSAGALNFFWKILNPLVNFFTFISEMLLAPFKIDAGLARKSPFVTREEFKYLIQESEAQGVIEPHERKIIYKIFDFGKKRARDMMNSIDKLVWFKPQQPISVLLDAVRRTNYSRFPIKLQADKPFMGLVNAMDVIYEKDKTKPLFDFIRPIQAVSSDMFIDNILLMLQSKREHMAVVVDADENSVGFVTIEDLLEEIVGEI